LLLTVEPPIFFFSSADVFKDIRDKEEDLRIFLIASLKGLAYSSGRPFGCRTCF
jgi:hypothetical protein